MEREFRIQNSVDRMRNVAGGDRVRLFLDADSADSRGIFFKRIISVEVEKKRSRIRNSEK